MSKMQLEDNMEVEITLENLATDARSNVVLSNSEDDECLLIEMNYSDKNDITYVVTAKLNIEELKQAIRKITAK